MQSVLAEPEARVTSPDRRSVLVVDDEPTIAQIVSRYLERAGYATQIASDGALAVDVASTLRPDLVVLDLKLPRVDGLEVMRRLRSDEAGRPAVIVLSGRAEASDRVLGLRLGADDYIAKPFSPAELVARVEAVLRRTDPRPAPEPRVVTSDLELDVAGRRAYVRGERVHLTRREFDLLLFLARHPGQALTRDDLMRTIWRYSFYTDTSTLTVHMRRLRAKIEKDPGNPRHLQTVWGVGYRFEP